jgi:sulfite oxidase
MVRSVRRVAGATRSRHVAGGHSWRQADLGPQVGPWAWRLWETTVDLPAGEVDIVARAWDTSAAVQPERAETLWNPRGYVNTSWARVRVTGRSRA